MNRNARIAFLLSAAFLTFNASPGWGQDRRIQRLVITAAIPPEGLMHW